MKEVWKPVLHCEGFYEVSNFGRVKSLVGFNAGGIRKPAKNKKGYLVLRLKGKFRSIHRLVAESFLGASDLQVNHKDMDKTNNFLDNLEYVTCQENIKHAYLNGRPAAFKGEDSHKAILTEKEVLKIRDLLKKGLTGKNLADRYKVSTATISAIKTRRNWKHI